MALSNGSHEGALEPVLVFFDGFDGQVRNQVSGLILGTGVDFVVLELDRELERVENVESGLSDFGADSVTGHQDNFVRGEIPGQAR